MRDELGTLPFDIGSSYPDQCNSIHVVQRSGETIFVPRWVLNIGYIVIGYAIVLNSSLF